MDYFVKPIDSLSRLINDNAEKLYHKLEALPLEQLKLPKEAEAYYIKCHHERKFFSVQTAAVLLYRSLTLKGTAVEDTIVMDYGAGVGSLYILAKMIGCKKVIYNDIREDMAEVAEIIAKALDVNIDLYIAADHVGTIQQLNENNLSCDIILSRNVVEHIYDLDDFYGSMHEGQRDALIYFSTTANYHNPAMLWYHKRLHKKCEKEYAPVRRAIIENKLKRLSEQELNQLTIATRGLAMYDLDESIENYKNHKTLPNPDKHYTNTCDANTGVWAEHIIPVNDYERIIVSKGYKLTILPAFWDTHYSSSLKNIFGKAMNMVSGMLGDKLGLKTTAFIYVIAERN